MSHYIDNLSETSEADLNHIGGKAFSLKRLIAAKFPVPPGYCINTVAFENFLNKNNRKQEIQAIINQIDWENLSNIQNASKIINNMIMQQELPSSLVNEIKASGEHIWNQSTSVKLAVRSSATAEDRQDLSFAGQYDSILNVTSFDDVIASVKKCWASLWSARALTYYHNNGLDSFTVSMALVVQEMVETKAAGVMFTVNPINHNPDEIVIHAAWGLGEGIVAGKVSPDEYIIDKDTGRIKEMKINRKAVKFSPLNTGVKEETVAGWTTFSQVVSVPGGPRKSRPVSSARFSALIHPRG